MTIYAIEGGEYSDRYLEGYCEGYADGKRDAVVHGHWYVYETGYEDTEAKCSICGFETLVNEPGNGLHMVGDLKYCSRCGAKMDALAKDINVRCKSDEVTV